MVEEWKDIKGYEGIYKISNYRLLAVHFIPNPDNLPFVNHIDENKLNNSINNLE